MGGRRRHVSFACFDKPDRSRETHRMNHMLKSVTAAAPVSPCGVSGSYPRNGHDAQSEQAGSQQVPQAVTVQLQSHGQRHGPQQIQHLHAGDAGQ